jgi:cytochrome c peroxidase
MRLLTITITCLAYLLFALPLWAVDWAGEPIQPIPLQITANTEQAALGKRLFYDARLSSDHTVSCALCHNFEEGGADRLVHSFGVEGREGMVNSPTVFNAALNIAQFWDGRAASLEEQVNGPIHGYLEMDNHWVNIIASLQADEAYRQSFATLYPTGITPQNIRHAIAEFERTLLTPRSRFDRYLRGDKAAINEEEKKGYALFKSYGCIACHQGRNVGGNMFQRLGVVENPPFMKPGKTLQQTDLGRFNVTGLAKDYYTFKVPSLRMVVCTPPYLHNGSEKTLAGTIQLMGRSQLGREISKSDVQTIIQFLYTLVGEYRGTSLEASCREAQLKRARQ